MRELSRVVTLWGAVLIFSAGASVSQQSPQPAAHVEAQQLEQRRPVERALGAKGTHAYTIALEARQFLDAAVNQRGVDVVVRVFALHKNHVNPDNHLIP